MESSLTYLIGCENIGQSEVCALALGVAGRTKRPLLTAFFIFSLLLRIPFAQKWLSQDSDYLKWHEL